MYFQFSIKYSQRPSMTLEILKGVTTILVLAIVARSMETGQGSCSNRQFTLMVDGFRMCSLNSSTAVKRGGLINNNFCRLSNKILVDCVSHLTSRCASDGDSRLLIEALLKDVFPADLIQQVRIEGTIFFFCIVHFCSYTARGPLLQKISYF